MKVIRDEELGGIMMIPLLTDWNIRRCHVVGCREIPNTIVVNAKEGIPKFGLCERHYQETNKPGGTNLNLEFDNEYDAFELARSTPA